VVTPLVGISRASSSIPSAAHAIETHRAWDRVLPPGPRLQETA
jgi:hypothetical protein